MTVFRILSFAWSCAYGSRINEICHVLSRSREKQRGGRTLRTRATAISVEDATSIHAVPAHPIVVSPSGDSGTGIWRNLYVKSDTTFIGTNTGVSGPVA